MTGLSPTVLTMLGVSAMVVGLGVAATVTGATSILLDRVLPDGPAPAKTLVTAAPVVALGAGVGWCSQPMLTRAALRLAMWPALRQKGNR